MPVPPPRSDVTDSEPKAASPKVQNLKPASSTSSHSENAEKTKVKDPNQKYVDRAVSDASRAHLTALRAAGAGARLKRYRALGL